MRLSDIYSSFAPAEQPASQAGPASDSTPKSAPMSGAATAVSWIGVLLALVLLRVVYEVGE